jgi:sterol O-acyltransferase
MWVIFKKLRGYLLVMQMMQLPLVMLSRTKFLKEKTILGNVSVSRFAVITMSLAD